MNFPPTQKMLPPTALSLFQNMTTEVPDSEEASSAVATVQPEESTYSKMTDCTKTHMITPPRHKESRLYTFQSQPAAGTKQRIERALSQRLYLIHSSSVTTCPNNGGLSITFNVLGSTGNVYDVNISKIPSCTCPDHNKGNLCKHILFVFLKVVGLSSSSSLIYQNALLSTEVKEIIERVSTRKAAVGVVANQAVREKYATITGRGDRKEIEGECPICFDPLGTHISRLTFCKKTCGQNFHLGCIKMWKSQCQESPTCPACRQEWVDETTTESQGDDSVEGYMNFGALQGQSRVRDTSTYYGQRRDNYYYYRY